MFYRKCSDYFSLTIVSQPSKCLTFMTFGEGCSAITNECNHLSKARDFPSRLILQGMKEDNVGQLGDHGAPLCEQQYRHGSCYISLFKLKSFDQFNTPQTVSIFRHLLSCGTMDSV